LESDRQRPPNFKFMALCVSWRVDDVTGWVGN
jgi:hypothetical protein